MSGLRLGIDLGGTKIECVALAPNGVVVARRRAATPRDDYREILQTVVDLVVAVEAEYELAPTSVGLGAPGSISPFTGLMRNSNSLVCNGRPFADDLAALLAPRALKVANDANCFAMSEASDGAAAGANVVFGVILGTGVGAGVIINGAPLVGVNGVAGEWGHTKLPAPTVEELQTPPCWCGRSLCLEQFLCGPAMAADHVRLGGDAKDGAEVARLANAGEPVAVAALARFVDRLGRALAGAINLLDPDIIVLGGGLSNIDRLPNLAMEAMRPHVFSDDIVTRIVANQHGDSSGVRGAAWLWPLEGK